MKKSVNSEILRSHSSLRMTRGNFIKKPAFTLAEVLITLGIIGVVAAITIPGLINNFKAKQLHSRLLKSYSTLQQAFKRMEGDDVSLDFNSYGAKTFYKTFANYLTGVTNCGSYGVECYGIELRKFYPHGGSLDDGVLLLNDGTLLLFENPPGVNRVYITVDLNGYHQKPNKFGYDLFMFQLVDEQIKAMGHEGTAYTTCDFKNENRGCTEQAISKSDYFIKAIKNIK